MVDAYKYLIDENDRFFDWFLMENSQNMTVLDLASQRSNKEIIKYLYEVIKKADKNQLKFAERRNNLFHYAAKRNECFPIVRIII